MEIMKLSLLVAIGVVTHCDLLVNSMLLLKALGIPKERFRPITNLLNWKSLAHPLVPIAPVIPGAHSNIVRGDNNLITGEFSYNAIKGKSKDLRDNANGVFGNNNYVEGSGSIIGDVR